MPSPETGETAEGKRLFPLVAAGGTLGEIFGAQIAARAMSWLDPYQLMLVAAVVLLGCSLLTHVGHRVGLGRPRAAASAAATSGEWNRRGGFTLILHDRYLLLIALAVFLLNLVNTHGDFVLAEIVSAKARTIVDAAGARRRYIAGFYGDFQTYVSTLTAVTQSCWSDACSSAGA